MDPQDDEPSTVRGFFPRPPPTARRVDAAASQRDRLLRAVVDVSAEQGWAQVRVADVIARAGVSRRSFYEHFPDLPTCALAAYDRGVEGLRAGVAGALGHTDLRVRPWRDVTADLLGICLAAVSSEPEFARFALVDVLALGPEGRRRYLESVARFHQALRLLDELALSQDPERVPLDDVTLAVVGGALARFMTVEALRGRIHDIPEHYEALIALFLRLLR